MRVLVAGAGGTLGMPLVRRLLAAGHEVHGITRSERGMAAVKVAGARASAVDAFDRTALEQRVREADAEVIVHLLTALPKRGPTRASHLEPTNQLRTEGTANLLAAARAAGVRRLVAESVVFAYGFADFGDRILDETVAPAPSAPSKGMEEAQRAALSLERQVEKANDAGELEGVVLRLGALYGENVPSSEFMLTLLRRRLMALPGGGNSILPWIELSDALAAIEAAIPPSRVRGVFNVVDDEPVEVHAFVSELASVFATPPPYRIPFLLGRALMPYGARFLDRVVIRASNGRLRRELGWAPAFPTYGEGLRHWRRLTDEASGRAMGEREKVERP
jgi:nucleoside-diphosphate-sugar epimerase